MTTVMRRLVFIQRHPTVSRQRFNPQKLRQRSGDRLPGNTHRSVQNQPVRPCWSAVQQVSVAASHFFIHRLLLDVGGANPRCVCVCACPQRLPDSRRQGGCVQCWPLPPVVQESGRAGSWYFYLLHPLQHRWKQNQHSRTKRWVDWFLLIFIFF